MQGRENKSHPRRQNFSIRISAFTWLRGAGEVASGWTKIKRRNAFSNLDNLYFFEKKIYPLSYIQTKQLAMRGFGSGVPAN